MSRKLTTEQNVEFGTMLTRDLKNEISQRRQKIREGIQELLKLKFPDTIEYLLPSEELKLLRIPKRFLSPYDLDRVNNIQERLDRYRYGCFNFSAQKEKQVEKTGTLFSLTIPGLPYRFCIDIMDSLINGKFNEAQNLANVLIYLPNGEKYEYPLDDEEYSSFAGMIYSLGIDANRYPRYNPTDVRELEKAENELALSKLESKIY
jgi:hypothetical protein